MYRRPKFLEILLKIREEMAREADYDVDFFVEMVRTGIGPATDRRYHLGNGEVAGVTKRAAKRPSTLTRTAKDEGQIHARPRHMKKR
jgi:hypothetical protein